MIPNTVANPEAGTCHITAGDACLPVYQTICSTIIVPNTLTYSMPTMTTLVINPDGTTREDGTYMRIGE